MEQELKIVTVTCSLKDSFSKKKAKELLATWLTMNEGDIVPKNETLINPFVTTIPIEDNKPKWTFMKFCKQNYQKLSNWEIQIQFNQGVNVKDLEIIERKGKFVLKVTSFVNKGTQPAI